MKSKAFIQGMDFGTDQGIANSVVSLSKHPQNGKEQVEDIQIQSDRCPDVLIIRKPLDQVVCVINDVSTENYSTHCTVDGR